MNNTSKYYFLNIFSNVIYFFDGKIEFAAAITPVLKCLNHYKMLIWFSRNTLYQYQCWIYCAA